MENHGRCCHRSLLKDILLTSQIFCQAERAWGDAKQEQAIVGDMVGFNTQRLPQSFTAT